MSIVTSKSVVLPDWLIKELKEEVFIKDINDQMKFVLNLVRKNIEKNTGGPFGAAVFENATGKLISAGTNVVVPGCCSVAHAEVVAIMMAEERLKQHRLDERYTLVSSAQPCVMCNGALIWSGIGKLVIGANREDVESITGFDEGPVPENWKEELSARGVEVVENIEHEEACEALRLYKEQGGELY